MLPTSRIHLSGISNIQRLLLAYEQDARFFLHESVLTLFVHFLLANAWGEDDEIVLITCRLQDPGLDVANGAVKEKLEKIVDEL